MSCIKKINISFVALVFMVIAINGQTQTQTYIVNLREVNYVTFSCIKPGVDFVLWYNSSSNFDVEIPSALRITYPSLKSINIGQLQLGDAGIYKCKDPFTNEEIKKFTLNVIYPEEKKKDPFALEWDLAPAKNQTLPFFSTKPAIVPCRAKGYGVTTKAFMIKDMEGNSVRRQLGKMGVVLHRPKASDSGTYECIAERGGRKITRQFNVIIRVDGGISKWGEWGECDAECGYGVQVRKRECNNPPPANGGRDCYDKTIESRRCRTRSCTFPRVVKFGYDMRNDDLTLDCYARGIPKPTVLWKLNGRRIPPSLKPNSETLVIPKNKKRSGSYSCTIRNSAGFQSIYINIRI